MAINFEEVAADALKLSLTDRVRLADRLRASLSEEIEDEAEIETLWLAEAKRRREEIRSGKDLAIDSAEVFRSARDKLKR